MVTNYAIYPSTVRDENPEKDRRVPPREPVEVPASYGRHLIHDRFAVAAEKSAVSQDGDKRRKKGKAGQTYGSIAVAEKAIVAAKVKLEAAGADLLAKGEAERELADADAALAALKA